MALGSTFGQCLSGVAPLSLGSLVALDAIVVGIRNHAWRLDCQG